MNKRGNYLRMKTKLILKLMSALDTEVKLSDADLLCLIQEPSHALVEVYLQKEDLKMVLINPGKFLQLWSYPPHIIDEYDFCPDQRILTHRLFGKPALGPSPPRRFFAP